MTLQSLFLQILNMSITSSYIILAVLLVRLFLKKAPKKYSYALWSVVLFRLCCPVSFTSVISLFSLKPFDMSEVQQGVGHTLEYIPNDIGTAIEPNISIGIPSANAFINDMVPPATVINSDNPMQIYEFIGSIVWIIGAVLLMVYGVVTCVILYYKMKNAIKLEGNLYLSNEVVSPFVLGFIKPRIFAPYGMDENTTAYILAHERYHIKRLDHIIKPFCFLVLSVYWFNPLCWLAFVLMSRDMEMSCDEKVLAGEDNIRKSYSTTLLSFASGKHFPAPSPLSFGETGIKSRIKNILDWKKPKLWITVSAVTVLIAVGAICISNPLVDKKLPDVFSKNYRAVYSVFDSTLASSKPTTYYNMSYYCFTSDNLIYTVRVTDDEAKEIGSANEVVKLSKENFDDWLLGGELAADVIENLRLENEKALAVKKDNEHIGYVLCQKNGDIYYAETTYINKLEEAADITTLNDLIELKYDVESVVISHNNPPMSKYSLNNLGINYMLDALSAIKDKFTEGRIVYEAEVKKGNTIHLTITENDITHELTFFDDKILYDKKIYKFTDFPEVFNVLRVLAYDGTVPFYISQIDPYQGVDYDLDGDGKDEYVTLGRGSENGSIYYIAAYKENQNGFKLLWTYGLWSSFGEGTKLFVDNGELYLITKPVNTGDEMTEYRITADETGVVLYCRENPAKDVTMIFDIRNYVMYFD
ncbi:MAG: hypothetical protein IKV36_00415 [Clostridia bacterium]|nr:hypothetical protein [Clostridia bacterium]